MPLEKRFVKMSTRSCGRRNKVEMSFVLRDRERFIEKGSISLNGIEIQSRGESIPGARRSMDKEKH